ncbi:hypothetical protein C0995_000378 [Termitomyces sp. Mi166|nr:hypothetical protein C0995_000378 [Termitomyces sp. Mi166\
MVADDLNPELDFLPLSNIAQSLSVHHSFVDLGSNDDDMVNIDNTVITNPDLEMDIDPPLFALPDLEEEVDRNPQEMTNLLPDTNLLCILESDNKDEQKTLFQLPENKNTIDNKHRQPLPNINLLIILESNDKHGQLIPDMNPLFILESNDEDTQEGVCNKH